MIGFVGLGSMGFPIAQNIQRGGFDVMFFARKPQVIEAAEAFGAVFCPDIEEIGRRCDAVIFFLNTAAQCEECLNKVLPGMLPGKAIIIGSTVLPEECLRLSRKCEAQGVCLLDAPVSGGVQGAIDGTLTIMVSGNQERLEQYRALMECYGKKISYIGPNPGDAQTMKAINQELVGINIASVCEAYVLGIKCGLDPNVIFDTISACSGTSRIFENRSEYIIARNFNKRSSLYIHYKDLGICQHLAKKVGMDLPIAAVCEQLYAEAMEFCDPEEDAIAVMKRLEREVP